MRRNHSQPDDITPMLPRSVEIGPQADDTARQLVPSLDWPDLEALNEDGSSNCSSIESPQPDTGPDSLSDSTESVVDSASGGDFSPDVSSTRK